MFASFPQVYRLCYGKFWDAIDQHGAFSSTNLQHLGTSRRMLQLLALAWQGPHAAYRAGRVGTRSAPAVSSCELDDPSTLCAYDPLAIDARFADQQSEVAGRIGSVGLAAFRVWRADDDGATLRAELSKLGPVFCKVGQTMATRPDIVGLETSRNLGKLQDAMEPEPDPATAMATLSAALGGEVSSKLCNISATPVAAASLAEVYRANLPDGTPVAVKVQRPGLERKVGGGA